MRLTYAKVKQLCKDMGVDVSLDPLRPGYVLSYRKDNRIYGPWPAKNLKDCLSLSLEIIRIGAPKVPDKETTVIQWPKP